MTISLILPYWDRQEAADRAFALLDKHYRGLDLEVVVVDDGNRTPFRVPETDLNVKVVRLPLKTEPKAIPTPWNEGVRHASGDIIILSCVEVLHETPVLQGLVDALNDAGENGYVLASAWCPESRSWHCHSTVNPPYNPLGTGASFCAAIRKSLYWKAGGFDEAYRDGAGYEDCDFINRLVDAGAHFIKRDDLMVIHPKTQAHIAWKPEAMKRNADIFFKKWKRTEKRPVTFCCVNVGNYEGRGAEYVNNLHDMVRRNLSEGYPGRFVCVTDDPTGLDERIAVIKAPEDVSGWWVKLWLFKRGVFADGERVIFMDLDTLVIGELDALASYRGQFAILRDFYYPQQVGPAVMSWEAGAYVATIWQEWDACGRPQDGHGDLWWINQLDQGRFSNRADKLQALFPGAFVSYKADCRPYPPKSAKVVCFHGQPRPHDAPDAWVSDVWKVGGSSAAELITVANTAAEQVANNVRHASMLPHPWLDLVEPHEKTVCIVGGGPSLVDDVDELRVRAKSGQAIYAVNGSAKYLAENGIAANVLVLLDSRPENVSFVTPPAAQSYFVASQCDKGIFEALEHERVTVFHANTENVLASIPDAAKPLHLISGGSTVLLNAIALAYTQGFRHIHLFGADSSCEATHHAYKQPANDADRILDVTANGQSFKAAAWMVAQVNQFQELALQLADEGCVITVHGRGLLPYVAQQMMLNQHKEAA